MLFLPILALAITQGQATASAQTTVHLGDKDILVNWVDPKPFEPEPDFAQWKGWSYLKGATPNWSAQFPSGYVKPTAVDSKPSATLRVKVIILAQRFESQGENPVQIKRFSMPDYAIQDQLESVARDSEYLRSALKGLADVDVDVEVRKTTFLATPSDAGSDPDHWVNARINGYGYEADDKVKRGPFHWVEVRIPGRTYPPFYDRAIAHLSDIAKEKGYQVGGGADPTADEVKDVLSFKPTSEAAFKAHRSLNWTLKAADPSAVQVLSNRTPDVLLTFTDDPQRGKVLRMTERGYYRTGALSLPIPGGSFEGHKKLSFWMRSESKDSLTAIVGPRGSGSEPPIIAIGGGSGSPTRLPFKYDGTWQKVTVPLVMDGAPVSSVVLSAPTGSEKMQLKNSQYFFDEFAFEDDDQPVAFEPLKPDFESAFPTMRLAALTAYAKAPSAELRDKAFKLLDDQSDPVRLAAIHTFANDPAAEPKLIENVFHIDGFVSEAAIQALSARNSELGWTQIRTALAPGTPLRRIAAAQALASKKDGMLAGPISGLIGDPDPAVRRAAALAIASLPGDESPKILSVFFNDVDPDVVSAAVMACNPDDPLIDRRLQYLSVNDPWDSVRAAAYLKMATSSKPDLRKEGWKGTRDDSGLVRAKFLESAPDGPELLPALKAGYGDPSSVVRIAVIKKIASDPDKLAGAVSADSFKAEFSPEVIQTLVTYATQLKLPDAVIESLRASQKELR